MASKSKSKYERHQGTRECQRRVRQSLVGQIQQLEECHRDGRRWIWSVIAKNARQV